MSGFSVPVFTWIYQGLVASNGQVFVYKTSTTTLQTIYSDGALTTPLPNPLTLDSNGQCKFYVSGSNILRLDGYTSTGTLIESIDPVYPVGATTVGTLVYASSNFTLGVNNAGNNIVATAPITISLPLTTTFSNSFSVQLNAQGGAITLSPFASDKIQQGSVGANYILPQGTSGELWTDAAGNWGLNFIVVATTQTPGNNSTNIATTAFVAQTLIGAAISGLIPSSIAGTNTTASLTISSGQAMDSTVAAVLRLASNQPWLVSNGNAINGYQGGTTLPNSSTIHFFVCFGASGTGTFASISLTPTLPTGYSTYYRRIFSLQTNSSGAPLPYTSVETTGGSITCYLTSQPEDVSVSNLANARTNYTLSVPSLIKVQPLIRSQTITSNTIILLSGDENDVTPTLITSSAPGNDLFGDGNNGNTIAPFLTTNTSGQIGAHASASSTTFYLVTRGWTDFRRN